MNFANKFENLKEIKKFIRKIHRLPKQTGKNFKTLYSSLLQK